MDLLAALALWLGSPELRHEAPLKVAPGTLQNIPQPLPYVLSEQEWGVK